MPPQATLKGKKNIYTCRKCAGQIVTVDVADGTTPFTIRCRVTPNCNGIMQSAFYRVDQNLPATHEWYRKSDEAARKESPAMQHHHKMGGLFLREASK